MYTYRYAYMHTHVHIYMQTHIHTHIRRRLYDHINIEATELAAKHQFIELYWALVQVDSLWYTEHAH